MKALPQLRVVGVIGALMLVGLACDAPESGRTTDRVFDETELSAIHLKIEVGLVSKDNEPRLAIKQSFVMPRNRLLLRLPDSYLRKENLYLRIEELAVDAPARLLAHNSSMALRILEAPVGETVSLQYYFRPYESKAENGSQESFSAPIIRDNYFQFVGSMALVYPVALITAEAFRVDLTWKVPDGFQIFNSFGAEMAHQSITTDFDKMRDAFFVAGQNIRSNKVDVNGQPVYITFEGTWDNITDKDFIDVVARLLKTQRETFGEEKVPYFLVNFLADNSNCGDNIKFAGTAHPNSFRAIIPGGPRCVFMPEMRQLISHELMHMWIGKKIRVGEERGHIDGKWFTEGFTDYFGRIMALRAQVISQDEFFSSLNRQLEKYYTSPERLITLEGLVERMYRRGYSNRTLEEVPYQQGEIMAWRLNQRIKVASNFTKSLDDALKDMLLDADRAGGYRKLTIKDLSDYLDRYAPHAFAEEYGKIVQGRLFVPPDLAQCRQPLQSTITRFRTKPVRMPDPIIFYGPLKSDCTRWLN